MTNRQGPMRQSDILHKDFQAMPYWWEAYKPVAGNLVDVPRKARVAIVGGGYAGLSCAIELADAGLDACVLEAAELGFGASTRSGGGVSGGVNIGKSFTGKVLTRDPEVVKVILASGFDAFSLIETLIERERIDCFWEKTGRFVGAWTPKDYKVQEQRVASLNSAANSGAYMVPRERQREELPADLARALIPKGRTLADTKRVLCYYRMSPDGKRMVFGGRARFTPVTPAVSAPILHGFMTDRFPQLRGTRVTHAWTGNVAFTWDALPHTGVMGGMHYAVGCNGSGVAMMTYLGRQTARRIIGGANSTCGFELEEFPDFPLYNGSPNWALPAVGAYYRFRDGLSRTLARYS